MRRIPLAQINPTVLFRPPVGGVGGRNSSNTNRCHVKSHNHKLSLVHDFGGHIFHPLFLRPGTRVDNPSLGCLLERAKKKMYAIVSPYLIIQQSAFGMCLASPKTGWLEHQRCYIFTRAQRCPIFGSRRKAWRSEIKRPILSTTSRFAERNNTACTLTTVESGVPLAQSEPKNPTRNQHSFQS